jgi:hypothetical protein
MVTSPKLSFIVNINKPTDVVLAPSETIRFSSLEFTANHLGRLSLSPEEWDSSSIFIGMVHNWSPSLHTVLEDSSNEGHTASGAGGPLDPPAPDGAMW